jgi:hypothetical protein
LTVVVTYIVLVKQLVFLVDHRTSNFWPNPQGQESRRKRREVKEPKEAKKKRKRNEKETKKK